ncbi:DnaA N-terminal domain-containing protein [Clostridium brassicae]|uniref:DnaA N-terminal domain-containing protein n=1 Tax=Clostridium brassicae TaxID=2999072 RepID=A0ABT4D8F3_9CLOT|nr:DnaA N-terminal domain-containing protein [Clostridium brassicae]MCY6958590.1 hypothetical protein [Clostridium brassicae]
MNIKEINVEVTDLIKDKIPETSYNTWCKYVENAYVQENNIVIPVENEFEKAIIEERYLELFNTAYQKFKDEFSYDKIIIMTDENTDSKQNKKEESEYKTAEKMKELADKKNEELIDIKKETEKALKKILETVEMMAGKGDYSTSYLCNNIEECNVIENVAKELEKLGFLTKIADFGEYKKAINIKWDNLEDENNEN